MTELNDDVTVVASAPVNRYRLDRAVQDALRTQLTRDVKLVGEVIGQTVLGPRDDELDALDVAARATTGQLMVRSLTAILEHDTTADALADAIRAIDGNATVLIVVVPTDHPLADTARITTTDDERDEEK